MPSRRPRMLFRPLMTHCDGECISCRWGLGGPNTWSALSELHLDANHLKGTLPMSWGSTGAFPQIQNITLANNELTGSIPNNWGTDQNLHSPFPNLKSITLLPQQGTQPGSDYLHDTLNLSNTQDHSISG